MEPLRGHEALPAVAQPDARALRSRHRFVPSLILDSTPTWAMFPRMRSLIPVSVRAPRETAAYAGLRAVWKHVLISPAAKVTRGPGR